MISLWSQLEEAWRDTLIRKSQGDALEVTARRLGIPWPRGETSEAAWRGALHALGYGARGTFASTYWAVEAALSDYNEWVECSFEASSPFVLARASGNWTSKHINRLVRTKYGLHWSTGPVVLGGQPTIELCPYSTTFWDAFPALDENEDLTAVVLPFTLREMTPGPIDTEGGMYPADSAETNLVEVSFYSPSISRYRPTYLADGFSTWKVTADVGTSRLVFPVDHGLSVDDVVYVFAQLPQSGVYAEPPPLLHKVPSPLTHGGLYYVESVPTSTTIKVKSTLAGAAVTLTDAGLGSFFASVPDAPVSGSNLAGHLFDDEHEIGNPTGAGPWPVYLDEGAIFSEVLRSLQRTLVTGVVGVIGWHPLLPGDGWRVSDL